MRTKESSVERIKEKGGKKHFPPKRGQPELSEVYRRKPLTFQ